MVYIVVATEYLTKWAEAKAVKTDTAAHAATFMYENIITRFGCPKIVVSDRGTHFLNDLISEMTTRFQIDHRKTTRKPTARRSASTGFWLAFCAKRSSIRSGIGMLS